MSIEIINSIKNIIKDEIIKDKYILLDNISTLNYYYNIKNNTIKIIHNIPILQIKDIINKLIGIEDLKLITKNIFIDKTIILNNDNIQLEFISAKLQLNIYKYKNLYYNLALQEYLIYTPINNIFTTIFDIELYFNLAYNSFTISNNIIDLIEIITIYLINDISYLKNVINSNINNFKHKIKIIKQDYNNNITNNYKKLLAILHNLEINDKLNDFINILNNEYNIINYILYDNYIINKFNQDKLTIEEYIQLIFISDEIDNDYICLLEENYNLDNYDELYSLVNIDKLSDLRKLKTKVKNNKLNLLSFDTNIIDMVKLRNCINVTNILLYYDIDNKINNYNLTSLKMAYIYKLYNNIQINDFEELFKFYNRIFFNLKIDKYNYIYNMIQNNELSYFEKTKMLNIPDIKKNFSMNTDIIDIIDYQDSFILLYEIIYNKKINLNIINNEFFDNLLNSLLHNIRSNKLININNISNDDTLIKDNLLEFDNLLENNDLLLNDLIFNNDEKKYKKKYINKKTEYNKLKIIETILLHKNFNPSDLNNFNKLNDELVQLLYTNYIETNLIIEDCEFHNENTDDIDNIENQ